METIGESMGGVLVENVIVKELNKIVGKKINDVILQLRDMMIINFGEKIEFSLHISSFIRVTQNRKLLFTSSDIFFNTDFSQKSDENDVDYLIDKNLKIIKKMMIGEVVTDLSCNEFGDVNIYLGNDCKIEIITDCLYRDYDYFRFIEFMPHYSDMKEIKSRHFVFRFVGEKFVFEEDV